MRQNGFSSIILVILLLIAIGFGGVFYYLTQIQNRNSGNNDNPKQTAESTVNNNESKQSPVPVASVNQNQQKKFQNSKYKFSLSYPDNWNYKENDPYVPNLAEYTVTFSSPDRNTGLDVWIKDGSWTDVERDILKDKNAIRGIIAGQPSIIQPQDTHGNITFVKHPFMVNKVIVFTNIGENLTITDQIQKTLKFE